MKTGVYRLGYTVVLYFLMLYIVPLIILTLMNGLLIKHVNKAVEKRRSMTNKPKLIRKTVSNISIRVCQCIYIHVHV